MTSSLADRFLPRRSGVLASAPLVALMVLAACGNSTGSTSTASGGSATLGGAAPGGAHASGGNDEAGGGRLADSGAGGRETSGGTSSGGTSSGGTSSGGASGSGGVTSGGAHSDGGSGGGATSRGCPSVVPGTGNDCAPNLLGLVCFYEDCSGSSGRARATCATAIPEIGNPVQRWIVDKTPCESRVDCAGVSCAAGEVCVIYEGGARFGQCGVQTCGAGPIECNCVSGCSVGCVLSSAEGGPAFTCNTCSDPRGCP